MTTRHPYLDGGYPRAYAHRGWHLGDLAGCENTMAAFRRAVVEGFGYLELDVHASADGVAFVHHDAAASGGSARNSPQLGFKNNVGVLGIPIGRRRR